MFAHPRSRRRALLAILIAGLALAMGLLLASFLGLLGLMPVSERSLVGTWVVHYRTQEGWPAGTDTLILKPDNTFVQICLPEKGKKIEAAIGHGAAIGRGPLKKYDRVRIVGTWHIVQNRLETEGMLGPPEDGIVAGNPYVRTTGLCAAGLPVYWYIRGSEIYARGDEDTDNADYFRRVR